MNKEYNNQIDSDMQVRKYDSKFVRYESLTPLVGDVSGMLKSSSIHYKSEVHAEY